MPEQTDLIRPLIEQHAAALTDALVKLGQTPRRQRVRVEAGGWVVSVTAAPPGADEGFDGYTECELACLTLLREMKGEPISGRSAVKELEKRGMGIFGEATVRRALRKLKKDGKIDGGRRGRPGYFMVEALPLVRLEQERQEQHAKG